jgi:uncharacterized protein (TIGR02145 family)
VVSPQLFDCIDVVHGPNLRRLASLNRTWIEIRILEKKVMKISESTSTLLLAVTLMVGCSNGQSRCTPVESRCTSMEYGGYKYDLVQIGDQCWFDENLRSEYYANYDAIPGLSYTTPASQLTNAEWGSTSEGAQADYNADYGRLYNWYAVDDARGLCPSGWHVPSDEEYTTLIEFLGGTSVAGAKMKSSSSWDGTNTSGFSGLAGGYRDLSGYFKNSGDYLDLSGYFKNGGPRGYFWSASASGTLGLAWNRRLRGGDAGVYRHGSSQRLGYSVRCLRD